MSSPQTRHVQPGVVIFLHIPKAAGLTLYKVLDREYGRSRVYSFRGGRQRLQKAIDGFRALPAARRDEYDLLRGHLPFGVHEWISRPATYFTLLREPVERVVSHYNYVKRTPQHALYRQVTKEKMTLADYVSSGINYELDNGQVRLISGVDDNVPFGGCSSDLLRQAHRHLADYFTVVGLVDYFDETLLLLRQALKWRRYPLYVPQNVTRERIPIREISPGTRALIEKHNSLDCELYEFVAGRFAERSELLTAGEMIRFRRWNRYYGVLGRAQEHLQTTVKSLVRFR
jgi:hypothetical protein